MQALRIDHVHVEVAERDKAADWYHQTLGLRRHAPLAEWAKHPTGPLILEGGDGHPTLALFAREAREVSRDATIAFRVTGDDFLAFLGKLDVLDLKDDKGQELTRADIVDHGRAWSIYFADPDQNRLEVTTYDYAVVANA
ncbi:MAG: VOC family protein [Pseudomonadota bacterium]